MRTTQPFLARAASSELFEMPPLVDTRLHVHGQGRVLVGVRPGDAIEDVKAKIHNQWGVSPNAQHLFFKGKPLREPLDSSREPQTMGRAVAVLLVLCALLGAATMAFLSITVPVTARVSSGTTGTTEMHMTHAHVRAKMGIQIPRRVGLSHPSTSTRSSALTSAVRRGR